MDQVRSGYEKYVSLDIIIKMIRKGLSVTTWVLPNAEMIDTHSVFVQRPISIEVYRLMLEKGEVGPTHSTSDGANV
jgi:hypothetical protein